MFIQHVHFNSNSTKLKSSNMCLHLTACVYNMILNTLSAFVPEVCIHIYFGDGTLSMIFLINLIFSFDSYKQFQFEFLLELLYIHNALKINNYSCSVNMQHTLYVQ